MKKALKTMSIVSLIMLVSLAVLIVFMIYKFRGDIKAQEEDQLAMAKSDEELLGEHLYIPGEDGKEIDVNLYLNDSKEQLPLVINLHGGAFIAGDADTLDTQSDRIANDWNVSVAAINYSLLKDGVTQEDVIKEITDTVKYLIARKETYHIDTDNIFLLGYSAGGYYAMASMLALQKDGISVKGQILCYAFPGDIVEQYGFLSEEEKAAMPQSLFVIVDGDPISAASLEYEAVLKENGTETMVITYENVKHGFIEENNPEYEKLHDRNKTSKSEAAEQVAREAEDAIKSWMEGIYGNHRN